MSEREVANSYQKFVFDHQVVRGLVTYADHAVSQYNETVGEGVVTLKQHISDESDASDSLNVFLANLEGAVEGLHFAVGQCVEFHEDLQSASRQEQVMDFVNNELMDRMRGLTDRFEHCSGTVDQLVKLYFRLEQDVESLRQRETTVVFDELMNPGSSLTGALSFINAASQMHAKNVATAEQMVQA